MKRLFKPLLIAIPVIFLITSCASINTYRSGRTTSFLPEMVKLDLTSEDMEYLGEMDISVNFSQYLLFIKIFESINEKEVSARTVNSMVMYGKRNLPMSPDLYRALYDVYVKYPDADFTIPVYIIAEQQNLFLGKKVKKTARIKVYKMKI